MGCIGVMKIPGGGIQATELSGLENEGAGSSLYRGRKYILDEGFNW